MLKKIFGSAQKILSGEHPAKPQIEQRLADMIAQIEGARWMAGVACDGLLCGVFPSQPPNDEDRIAAMSAAMLSLEERIAGELKNGSLQYTILAGQRRRYAYAGLEPAIICSPPVSSPESPSMRYSKKCGRRLPRC